MTVMTLIKRRRDAEWRREEVYRIFKLTEKLEELQENTIIPTFTFSKIVEMIKKYSAQNQLAQLPLTL